MHKMNFVHQAGDQPRLYYGARSTNHQGTKRVGSKIGLQFEYSVFFLPTVITAQI